MKRSLRFLSAALLLSGMLVPARVLAAQTDVTIRFRPHCEQTGPLCREFPLYDLEHAITNGLVPASLLDLDILITNPSRQRLQSVQSWLAYDTTVLRGKEVRIADTFPLIAPGEQSFAEEDGLVKLGASNVSGGAQGEEIVFARVVFEVLASGSALNHAVRFHEFSLLGQEGKTKVLLVEDGKTVNVLRTRPRDLLLFFGEGAPPTILPPSGDPVPPGSLPPVTTPPGQVPPGTQPPVLIPPPGGTVPPILSDENFAQLQPQGLEVTSEEDKVYLRWQALSDPRVRGYNLYYGTVSGQYIQRRTVSMQTTGITVRGLPIGKRYFFAVTAFNALEQETEFSFEVAVTVGDALSSTAPFSLASPGSGAGGGAGTDIPGIVTPGGGVPGQTGMPFVLVSALLFLAAISAFLFRSRRTL